MRASVIISVYTLERLGDLRDCIAALVPQLNDDIEVLLVLENDEELIAKAKAAFKYTTINIQVSSEPGLTPARNLGMERSTGDIVIFLDDDAVPDPNWLKELLEPYSDERVLAVGGGVVPFWEGSRPRWFPRECDWIVGSYYLGHPKRKTFVRNVIGANLSFRRQILKELGGFSTNIAGMSVGGVGKEALQSNKRYIGMSIAGDESELCMRLRSRYGPRRILYVPDASVRHKVRRSRQTLGYAFRRAYVEGVSKAVIEKGFKGQGQLDTEKGHLKYLLAKGMPSKLKKPWQLIALASCTLLVLLGYARGRLVWVRGAL